MAHLRDHLTDRDREALRLARDLRDHIQAWLSRHGIIGTLVISPLVDPAGQPSVLVRMNSPIAHALMHALNESHPASRPQDHGCETHRHSPNHPPPSWPPTG